MGTIRIKVDYTDNFSACTENEDIACISTGRTIEELKKNMDEALHFHIEGMLADGIEIPEEFLGEWEYDWHLTTRAVLHFAEKLISKAAISKVTGINQQQLTHYASGYRIPRPAMEARIRDGIHQIGEKLLSI